MVGRPIFIRGTSSISTDLVPEESYTLALDLYLSLEGQITDVFEVASNDPDGAQSSTFLESVNMLRPIQQWDNPVDPPSISYL